MPPSQEPGTDSEPDRAIRPVCRVYGTAEKGSSSVVPAEIPRSPPTASPRSEQLAYEYTERLANARLSTEGAPNARFKDVCCSPGVSFQSEHQSISAAPVVGGALQCDTAEAQFGSSLFVNRRISRDALLGRVRFLVST